LPVKKAENKLDECTPDWYKFGALKNVLRHPSVQYVGIISGGLKMRNFNEADRKKKKTRIKTRQNPANLTAEELSRLEKAVKKSLADGYLPCPAAFKVARESRVPGIAIGEMTDRLGVRITDCQIGCFKVEKTVVGGSAGKNEDKEIAGLLADLNKNDDLTCARVFALSRQFKCTPLVIANIANNHKLKIHQCQLGCF
jgi:hypothetical protein